MSDYHIPEVPFMPDSDLAPIAVFAYRRTAHLARMLASLQACPEYAASRVFVFSDGPKDGASAADITEVRKFLRENRSSNMTIVEAPHNHGLAASIIAGVTELCDKFGQAIVIEDDLVISPCTLTWFNLALRQYADESSVWQISADQYEVPEFASRSEGVFLHKMTSWGWATWKRAWDNFDPKAVGWEKVKTDPELARCFDLGGACQLTEMLLTQMTGHCDSWAIRWEWSAFRAHAIALHPPRSLVRNIGHDATATHTRYRLLKRLIPRHLINRGRGAELMAKRTEPCPAFPPHIKVLPENMKAVADAILASRSLSSRIRRALFEP